MSIDSLARGTSVVEKCAEALSGVIKFAGGWIAPDREPRSRTFFEDLAKAVLHLRAALDEADKAIPRFRIRERLDRAAGCGVVALETAANLLIGSERGSNAELAGELESIASDGRRREWLLWLTYVMDQLLNSPNPSSPDNVPPTTSRGDWRKAELAFGCVLFTDDTFREMQESVDQACSHIDTAFQSGGHGRLKRPPGRVRDLVRLFDPRALGWYAGETLPPVKVVPPESFTAITEPSNLRHKLEEIWTAGNCLIAAIDRWQGWFRQLQEEGDADPAIALNCNEFARRALRVLHAHKPRGTVFERESEDKLLAMLPPIPMWSRRLLEGQAGRTVDGPPFPAIRWQEDKTFLDQYYWNPERRMARSSELRGAAFQLVEMLKCFPLSVLSDRVAGGDTDPPIQRQARQRMSKEEANQKAMELAKCDPQFVNGSLRDWAKAIGCSNGLVKKLPLWTATMRKTGRGRDPEDVAPKAISLTDQLNAATGEGDRDEVLEQLIADQERDREPSPLDCDAYHSRPKKVRTRKRL